MPARKDARRPRHRPRGDRSGQAGGRAWYRALALCERLPAPPPPPEHPELARRRLARWRAQPPFSAAPELLARRLAADGLTESDALCLLGESDAALCRRLTVPNWMVRLEEVFNHYASGSGAALPLPPLAAVANPTGVGFLGLVLPLLRAGYDRLIGGLQELNCFEPGASATGRSGPALDPALVGPQLFGALLKRLLALLPRTLVLELQAARLEGRLAGATPEERFASFARRLRKPRTALAILRRYPVLARLVLSTIEDWRLASLELCRRLRADWPTIVATFAGDTDPGPLVALRPGAGDFHRHGRSVALLDFASGLQLVYKPRSLGAELAFQRLLAWANARGFQPALPVLGLLDRGEYGWAEFVTARSCSTRREVERFYERQGGYLALFYLLDASDQHHENIIAAGENPYAVDLETLFHPRVDGPRVENPEDLPGTALFHSVLRVGFLPKWMASPEGARLEMSGLGSIAGQESLYRQLQLDRAGTDEMRFGRRTLTMPGARNRPLLDGREAEVTDYGAELKSGFARMVRLLLAHREELLGQDGPLAAFDAVETRVVFRPTSTYGELEGESVHPDVLGNALLRDQLFDRLWVAVELRPFLGQLIAAERAELARGDIPLFTVRPASPDLWTAAGRLRDFFSETGAERVRRNVERLSEADLALQLWTLTGCLTALDLSRRLAMPQPHKLQPAPARPSRGELLGGARALAERLETIAFRGPRDAWWMTLAALPGQRWAFATAQADLYEGVPGIVLFLAYLAQTTGEERWAELARRGLETTTALLERATPCKELAGAWNGLGGLVYTFAHLGVLWRRDDLLARAESWLPDLARLVEADEHHDLMNGTAGAAAALLVLAGLRPASGALDLAHRCGKRLAASAVEMECGVAWPPGIEGERPLAGFSHGSAGIAWALLRLAAAADDRRLRELGLAAIDYERGLFDPVARNWRDFRRFGTTVAGAHALDPLMAAWCNGAAGIGLARLGTLPLLDDAAVRGEIAAALSTTLARGFGKTHCLCHGDLGNIELLLTAARRLGRPELEERAYRLAGGVLADIRNGGWRLGMPRGSEPPGLMVGLAGVGYGLLRLAAPEQVPAVLLLEGPRVLS